jgi:hypothetical protein
MQHKPRNNGVSLINMSSASVIMGLVWLYSPNHCHDKFRNQDVNRTYQIQSLHTDSPNPEGHSTLTPTPNTHKKENRKTAPKPYLTPLIWKLDPSIEWR